jgi:hypothetical protein
MTGEGEARGRWNDQKKSLFHTFLYREIFRSTDMEIEISTRD